MLANPHTTLRCFAFPACAAFLLCSLQHLRPLSIRPFAHTYLMLQCSQRHFDRMRHMSLPTRRYPFNPAIVNPANISYSISCSRTHIQPFDVSLSQPVQPSVPVYKVTSFSCFRSPSQHLAGPFYAPFSTYVCSHQLA